MDVATEVVVMVKLGECTLPAATVTVAGTDATAGLELDKDTTAPVDGAGPFSTTILVD